MVFFFWWYPLDIIILIMELIKSGRFKIVNLNAAYGAWVKHVFFLKLSMHGHVTIDPDSIWQCKWECVDSLCKMEAQRREEAVHLFMQGDLIMSEQDVWIRLL